MGNHNNANFAWEELIELEKNFSENNFAICFQFSLGIRGELTTFEKELSALRCEYMR